MIGRRFFCLCASQLDLVISMGTDGEKEENYCGTCGGGFHLSFLALSSVEVNDNDDDHERDDDGST
jgi:hypothetical protein